MGQKRGQVQSRRRQNDELIENNVMQVKSGSQQMNVSEVDLDSSKTPLLPVSTLKSTSLEQSQLQTQSSTQRLCQLLNVSARGGCRCNMK